MTLSAINHAPFTLRVLPISSSLSTILQLRAVSRSRNLHIRIGCPTADARTSRLCLGIYLYMLGTVRFHSDVLPRTSGYVSTSSWSSWYAVFEEIHALRLNVGWRLHSELFMPSRVRFLHARSTSQTSIAVRALSSFLWTVSISTLIDPNIFVSMR